MDVYRNCKTQVYDIRCAVCKTVRLAYMVYSDPSLSKNFHRKFHLLVPLFPAGICNQQKITWSWCHTSLIANATVNAYSIWHNLSLYLRSQTVTATAISLPTDLNWIFETHYVSFLSSFFFRLNINAKAINFLCILERSLDNWNILEFCLWRRNFLLVAQTFSEIARSIKSSRCVTSAFHKSYSSNANHA